MDFSKVLALKKSFSEIDLNGNGTIGATELKECLRNARTEVPADDVLKQAIKDFDSDGDGELTFDEVSAHTLSTGAPAASAHAERFTYGSYILAVPGVGAALPGRGLSRAATRQRRAEQWRGGV